MRRAYALPVALGAMIVPSFAFGAVGFSDDFSGPVLSILWATNGYSVPSSNGDVFIGPVSQGSTFDRVSRKLVFTATGQGPGFATWTTVIPPNGSADWQATLRVTNLKRGSNGFASVGIIVGARGVITNNIGFGVAITSKSTNGSTGMCWEAGPARACSYINRQNAGGLQITNVVSYANTLSISLAGITGGIDLVQNAGGLVATTSAYPAQNNPFLLAYNGFPSVAFDPVSQTTPYPFRAHLSAATAKAKGEVRLFYSAKAQRVFASFRELNQSRWTNLASLSLAELGLSTNSNLSLGIFGAAVGEQVTLENRVTADNFRFFCGAWSAHQQ